MPLQVDPLAGDWSAWLADHSCWQVHVYGSANAEIETVCKVRQLPLNVCSWRPDMGRAGLRRDAVYLVRPDGYVALADPEGSATAITSYLDVRKLEPMKARLSD